MAYKALYRKYRPNVFDDVYGQEHITSILRYEAMRGSVSHAYLFSGSRGTGKTTCAKIIAKAANCLSPVNGNPCGKCEACLSVDSGTATDVVEMDAASNNGVDNIRELRDGVVYTPAELRYRVYIIDEVHMLSVAAFNALDIVDGEFCRLFHNGTVGTLGFTGTALYTTFSDHICHGTTSDY